MRTMNPATNVYYLTPPLPAEAVRAPRVLILRLRVLIFWWHLRLTVGEVVGALRRFGRAPVVPDTTFLEDHVATMPAEPPPPSGPARIIDLAAARVRLRA
jgi:hypothetical protein